VILFVGSGYERKGLPSLLQALRRMSAAMPVLWVVGRDKQETLMRKLAQTLASTSASCSSAAQTDVRPFYGAADVFALPTLYDPFPNAALEALACGLPLITTTTCGAAELVTAANGAGVSRRRRRRRWRPPRFAVRARRGCATRHAPASPTSSLTPMAAQLVALYSQLAVGDGVGHRPQALDEGVEGEARRCACASSGAWPCPAGQQFVDQPREIRHRHPRADRGRESRLRHSARSR
jgi:UDP-glucose:(heptosyl)LPS alpha-1,3-glucosyltransferase